MADSMPKEQFEFISKIQADMLESTNMTEHEAWDFGFRCWQCGYAKVEKKPNEDFIHDEELEQRCSEVLDRMMKDDRYFLHVLIKACAFRVEKLAEERSNHERRV